MNGVVIKYKRDNIDTDAIIPGTYLKIHDYAELATHAMEGLDTDFHSKIKSGGDIIVAGKNFGCGSSREHAPIALAHSGINAVTACLFERLPCMRISMGIGCFIQTVCDARTCSTSLVPIPNARAPSAPCVDV